MFVDDAGLNVAVQVDISVAMEVDGRRHVFMLWEEHRSWAVR